MTIFVRAEGDRKAEAWFETYGCPTAIACGSWLTQWLEDKMITDVPAIEAEDLATVFKF